MNIISLIICSFILPILSLKQTKAKLCINCKHFIPDNHNGEFGKCSFFQKKSNEINFLVNGIDPGDYYYCSISRETTDMCGVEGKHYKKKINKIIKK